MPLSSISSDVWLGFTKLAIIIPFDMVAKNMHLLEEADQDSV